MKLTKKKAIKISIELWTHLAETGEEKEGWDGWKKYEEMEAECALCEYDTQRTKSTDALCFHCPYYKKFGGCMDTNAPYQCWDDAKTPQTRKKYAKLFLEQLKEL